MLNTHNTLLYQKFIIDLLSDPVCLSEFSEFDSIQNPIEKKNSYSNTIQNYLIKFILKYNESEINKFAHTDIQNQLLGIKEMLSANPTLLDLLSPKSSLYAVISTFFVLISHFDIKSISDIIKSNCIVDPLGNTISNINNIQIDIQETNDQLLKYLSKNPNYIYQLSSRKFEEVIAEILMRKGYEIELTTATRDGGKDIYAAHKTDLGSFLYIIECKKNAPNNKVGVSVLRNLYGVVSKENATCGIIATTSYFTKPAQEFQQDLKFRMSLKDFNSIKQWLYEVI